ncbi:MAG: TolC family protein [Planctomycetota bacterium]|nr:TolC family protein [Planctomycetota bacterium]
MITRRLQQRPDLMAARAEVRASRSLSRASSAWGHPIVSARTGIGRFGAEASDLDDQETAEVGIGWQFGFDSGATHRRAIAIFEETQLAMKKLELRISAQIRESLARLHHRPQPGTVRSTTGCRRTVNVLSVCRPE